MVGVRNAGVQRAENEIYHHPPNQEASGDFRSSLAGAPGHGTRREKRPSVAETLEKIQEIMRILPESAKQEIGRDIAHIRQNPEAAIKLISDKIRAYREIIDMLDNPISTDEALQKLEKLIPERRDNVN